MVYPVARRLVRSVLRWPMLALAEVTAAGLEWFVRDNSAYAIFYRHGYHLLRQHYYLPIPDKAELDDAFWERQSALVGLEMNDSGALELLDNVVPGHAAEFRERFPLRPSRQAHDSGEFYLLNGTFMAVDAHVYYSFIRHFRPQRIVEIGAGNSTLVAAAASVRNLEEQGQAPHLTAIEPFPAAWLKRGLPGLSQLIEQRVQDVDLEVFTSLRAGDILFIDSTHVLRAGGDVQLEYCEILPRLAPGVLVHIHDISLPKPYPRVYFEQNHYYWNEQYLLQAFLAFNSRFEVLWPGNYLMLKYPDRVCAVLPEVHAMREVFPQSEPSSFWIRVRP